MKPFFLRALAVVVFSILTSCAGREEKVIACAVSHAWHCPQAQIEVESLGAASYHARGCGQEDTYYCKVATEGCADKRDVVLATRMCQ